MGPGPVLDEAQLVLIASTVTGRHPQDTLTETDMSALARVTATIEACADPLDAAAAALVAIATERPFGEASRPAAWLACVLAAPKETARLAADESAVVQLVSRVSNRELGIDDVRAHLADQRGRLPWACPSCGRTLHAHRRPRQGPLFVSPAPVELMARCAVEHGVHDRRGRALAPA